MYRLRAVSRIFAAAKKSVAFPTLRKSLAVTCCRHHYNKDVPPPPPPPPPPLFEDATEESVFEQSLVDVVNFETHSLMLQEYHLQALDTQRVLVVQPFFRTGAQSRQNTRKEYILDETLGLVNTLGWTLVDKVIINVDEGNPAFFGSGQLTKIKDLIDKIEHPDEGNNHGSYVSAVFISTFKLTPGQIANIEEVIEKPVLDRFNVVLQIFKRHAQSPESKIQVQMAEIPYLKQRLEGDHEMELLKKFSKHRKGEDYFKTRRSNLAKRERKLKKGIEKLVEQRATLRKNRFRLNVPSIAVVGYTNSGKTSLIKAITGERRLQPLDKLFATLDVSMHGVELPSLLKAVFVDTVGFISDIPTTLIASFSATLEDALLADVIVHVRDMSNPDHVAQDQNVKDTLDRINVPQHLIDNMIVVGNKIDLIDPEDWQLIKNDGIVPVSCKAGFGLKYLLNKIDQTVIQVKGKRQMIIKVPIQGGLELEWLNKNAVVSDVQMNQKDQDYWNVKVLIDDIEFNRFKKVFLGKRR